MAAVTAGWRAGETNEDRLVAIGLDAWKREGDTILHDPEYGVITHALVIIVDEEKHTDIEQVIRRSVRTLLHGPG
jgi:hypothetical protein